MIFKTAGLKLQPNTQRVVFSLAHALAHQVRLGTHAQLVLHMVALFVREHVDPREVTRRTKVASQRLMESKGNVEFLVTEQ